MVAGDRISPAKFLLPLPGRHLMHGSVDPIIPHPERYMLIDSAVFAGIINVSNSRHTDKPRYIYSNRLHP